MASQAKINAKISANTTEFEKAIGKCRNEVKGFAGSQLSSIKSSIGSAFAIGAVAAWGKSVMAEADSLVQLSETIGMTTDSLQALYSAGRGNNLGIEDIDGALSKLAKAQDEVVSGNKGVESSFNKLGISGEQVASSSMEQLIQLVAIGAQATGTMGEIDALLGKNAGVKWAAQLSEIATIGFAGITKNAKEMGEVIDAIDLQRMAQASDELEHTMKRVSDGFVKAFNWIFNLVKDIGAVIGAWSVNGSYIKSMKMMFLDEIGSGKDRLDNEKKVADAKLAAEKQNADKLEAYKKNKAIETAKELAKATLKHNEKSDDEALDNLMAKRKKMIDDEKKNKALDEKLSDLNVDTDGKLQDAGLEFLKEKENVREGFNPRAMNQLATQGAGVGLSSNLSYTIAEQGLRIAETQKALMEKHLSKLDEIKAAQISNADEITKLRNAIVGE